LYYGQSDPSPLEILAAVKSLENAKQLVGVLHVETYPIVSHVNYTFPGNHLLACLNDGRVPADLVGLSTLESVEDLAAKKTSAANIAVLKKLAAAGALLAKQNLTHSYPHCWRSKTPIIFRAVDQWFVSLDKAGHRQVALAEITKIAQNQGWIPAWGEARIRGAVESRPDWCISRQRSWGVPIIAFYGPDKKAYLDAGVVRAVAGKIATRGTNFWYDSTATEIPVGAAVEHVRQKTAA